MKENRQQALQQRQNNIADFSFLKTFAAQELDKAFALQEGKRLASSSPYRVYYCKETDGTQSIFRFFPEESLSAYQASGNWLPLLGEKGLAVPEILAQGRYGKEHYLQLSYLPGTPLGEKYRELTPPEKHALARQLVGLLAKVEEFPKGEHFGPSFGVGASTWMEVQQQRLELSRQHIIKNSLFSPAIVREVGELLLKMEDYMSSRKPTPFIKDLTPNHILLGEDNTLSGIIGVQDIWYGDNYQLIGQTRMALMAADENLSYIEDLLFERNAHPKERKATILYTLISCVEYMSRLGTTFTQGKQVEVHPEEMKTLSRHYHSLLSMLDIMLA